MALRSSHVCVLVAVIILVAGGGDTRDRRSGSGPRAVLAADAAGGGDAAHWAGSSGGDGAAGVQYADMDALFGGTESHTIGGGGSSGGVRTIGGAGAAAQHLAASGSASSSGSGGAAAGNAGSTNSGPITVPKEILLNYVTILLPYNLVYSGRTRSVTTRLAASGSCFEFTSQSSSIVRVEPDPSTRCSVGGEIGHTAASISTVLTNPEGGRKAVWVEARDLRSGARTECEVFVDRIQRLEILTKTRRVNVGDIEELEVQAYDPQNNVFTSLEGLPFEWADSFEHILRRMSFEDAALNVSDTRRMLESNGLGTDVLPVQGLNPGKANVTVRLLTETATFKAENTVEISVAEPLYILPTIARLAPCAELPFVLQTRVRELQMRRALGETQTRRNISMPSTQYKWSALPASTNVIAVDTDLGVVSARVIGSAKVAVEDVSLRELSKESEVYVVNPHSIVLQLIAHGDRKFRPRASCAGEWYVSDGQRYDFRLLLRDRDENEMIITSNMAFQISLQGESLARIPSSSNQEIQLKAQKPGDTTLHVKLDKIVSTRLKQNFTLPTPIVVKAVVHVTPNVSVSDERVVLPFTGPHVPHSYAVTANGGSGQFEWTTPQPGIVSAWVSGVGSAGVGTEARLMTRTQPGSTVVTAADRCNSDNRATIDVRVTPPARLLWVPAPVEIQVDKQTDIAVEVTDHESRAFQNCSALTVHAQVTDGASIAVLTPSVSCHTHCPIAPGGGAINAASRARNCFVVTVKAVSVGFAELVVRFRDLTTPLPISIVLAAFDPVQVSPPAIIVAEGTSVEVTWLGGPLPWPRAGFPTTGNSDPNAVAIGSRGSGRDAYFHQSGTAQSGLTAIVVAADPDHAGSVLMKQSLAGDIHTYKLQCLSVHSQYIEIRVHNEPCPSNPSPVTVTTRVKFDCYPKLKLAPDVLTPGVNKDRNVTVRYNHPLASSVEYWTDKPHIASVNPTTGVVHGVALGETVLHGRVKRPGQDRGLVSAFDLQSDGLHDAVLVVVRFDNFVIHTPTSQLLHGQETFVHIEGSNEEVPGDASFDSVEITWTSDDPAAVQLLPPLVSQSTLPARVLDSASMNRAVRGFSTRVVGRRPGKSTILARITVHGQCATSSTSAAAALAAERELEKYAKIDYGLNEADAADPVAAAAAKRKQIEAAAAAAGPACEPARFEQWMVVTVLEPLELLSPASLLLPYGARAQITTTLDDSGSDISYELLVGQQSCKSLSCTAPVTVGTRGNIIARTSRPAATAAAGTLPACDDAVVLVRATPKISHQPLFSYPSSLLYASPASTAAAAAATSGGASPDTQSVAVRVSVRDVNELSIVPTATLLGPMCVGSNISIQIVVRDHMGRAFTYLDGWGGESGASGALAFRCSRPDILRVQKNSNTRKEIGTVSTLSFSALNTEGFAVVKLWLVNHTSSYDIAPVYIRVDVAAPPNCGETLVARMFIRLLPSVPAFPTQTLARREWAETLQRQIASTLSVAPKRIAVVSVDPIERVVAVDILPDSESAVAVTTASSEVAASVQPPSAEASAAALPLALAERFQKLVLLTAAAAAPAASGSGASAGSSTAAAIQANAASIDIIRRCAILSHVDASYADGVKIQKLTAADRDSSNTGTGADAQWLDAAASAAAATKAAVTAAASTDSTRTNSAAPKVCDGWYAFMFDSSCESVSVTFLLSTLLIGGVVMYTVFDRVIAPRGRAPLIDPASRGETMGPGQTSSYERVNRFYQPPAQHSGSAAGVSMGWS